ncbi:hypothetical protein SDRG_13765 [Saprolegnia diclina VS20]|uniref:Uncharacterized protein n=1 Tax=Saprolegnia diclina (strain VS20) TaxID=1156394 RepID=T0RFJ8_SAPDV|nr:hypothetical protein SDRG_13765 [Saprolegnia diclina VS20]EQC28437.1 hypothetical protein SDRG_13765 [Saprolegnia diclina VS20]|eukprot:XP_008618085.1 hypothetical protein SDRG_13765 [Saprolegnia diclina VS20]
MTGQRKGSRKTKQSTHHAPTGKEQFEEAVELLRSATRHPSAPWLTFEMPHHVEPLLRVGTMDEWLGWPLCKYQAHQVMCANPTSEDGVAVVPAAHLAFESADWHQMLDAACQHLTAKFASQNAVSLELSHLVLDSKGSAASLVPARRPAHSMGTMYLLLPSHYKGGGMTLLNDGSKHTWKHDAFLTRLHCLAQATATTIFVDPITHGTRVLLVYHLLNASHSTHFKDAVAKLSAAASSMSFQVGALGLSQPNPKLSLETLLPVELDFVQALRASGDYDVVLAEHPIYVNFTGTYDIRLAGKKQKTDAWKPGHKGYGPRIHRFQALPGAPLPDAIAAGVQDLEVEVRLFEKSPLHYDNYQGTRYAIVFWPKCRRLDCASLADAVNALLHAAQQPCPSPNALLGQRSVIALADALLARLGRSDEVARPTYAQSLTTYGAALILLRHLPTVQRLVGKILRSGTSSTCFEKVASMLFKLLAAFGWEPLSEALHTMMRRWAATSCGLQRCYQLVARWAGAAPSPLGLKQPFAVELIVSLWSTIAAKFEHALDQEDDETSAKDARIVFASSLSLELYVTHPKRVRERWLANSLPDRAVAIVASFLGPIPTLRELVLGSAFDPLIDMPPGFAATLRPGSADHVDKHVYTDSILHVFFHADIDTIDHSLDTQAIAALLAIAATVQKVAVVLDRLSAGRRLALAPAIYRFARHWPHLASENVLRHCSRVLLRNATNNVAMRIFNGTGHVRQAPVQNAVAAISFFATYDRSNLHAFTEKWLCTVEPHAIGDVVIKLHVAGPAETDLIARLAHVYLDAVSGDGARLTDYALLEIDVPPCCESCTAFEAYLRDPLRITFNFGDWKACNHILAIILSHPLQLEVQDTASPSHDDSFWCEHDPYDQVAAVFARKVRQPGQATPAHITTIVKAIETDNQASR